MTRQAIDYVNEKQRTDDIYREFLDGTKEHKAIVRIDETHENGVYRNIYVGKPFSGTFSWQTIQTPGTLTIVGDIADGFVFQRYGMPESDLLRQFALKRPMHPAEYVKQLDRNEQTVLLPQTPDDMQMLYWQEKLAPTIENTQISELTLVEDVLDGIDDETGYSDALKRYESDPDNPDDAAKAKVIRTFVDSVRDLISNHVDFSTDQSVYSSLIEDMIDIPYPMDFIDALKPNEPDSLYYMFDEEFNCRAMTPSYLDAMFAIYMTHELYFGDKETNE